MKVAVVGASGYVGLELLRILLRHPEAEIVAVTSEQRAGQPLGEAFPSLRGLTELRLEAADPAAIGRRAELAFTALPHGASSGMVAALRKQGVTVADTSADFRLLELDTYRATYGAHEAPELLGSAVYGMPELYRDALRGAGLIAVPGCYPTGTLLPLAPFLRAGLVATESLCIDAKSGVSGAGRKLAEAYLFSELDASSHAYAPGGAHRHVPEIEQEIGRLAGTPARVALVPYLLPTIRGIVTTVFARLLRALDTAEARDLLARAYADEPFVRVLPEGETPRLSAVRGSNFCDVNALVDARTGTLVLLSAIDNLVKGASGQAVQCANVCLGLDETTGLREAPLAP